MLLRNPISTTKRFFQRTLESFKSLLSGCREGSYQRLQKTRHMESQSDREHTKMVPEPPAEVAKERIIREKPVSVKKSSIPLKAVSKERGGERQRMELEMREVKICLVAKKLKEMEMVDKGNVDHLLDIEEVFHYYSRLTCPSYLDIVDEFLMELYAEFLGNSRLK